MGYLKQPGMAAAPMVSSARPTPLGTSHVSDPTLVGSRVQLWEPRWDPMLDEALIPASVASSRFVCHLHADATLVVAQDTMLD
jgi:hypothetical protein